MDWDEARGLRSPQLADDPGVAKVPSAASAPWQRHELVS